MNPLPIPELSLAQEERFHGHVARRGDDECWEWSGRRTDSGYGRFKVRDQYYRATHFALVLAGHARPEGLLALHSCDNPPCCNPRHLRWGTHAENSADCVARGRRPNPPPNFHGTRRGEMHERAKLTPHLVRMIRSSSMGYKALARLLGVERTTIRSVKRGASWRHVQ